jgi:ssDNA-binding Zn-finger/Zn-ribbon topoisomerase 1
MSCKCKKPMKVENSAYGKKFFVCAKSKGGCGEEIIELDFGTFNPYYDLYDDCPNCSGTGIVMRMSSLGAYDTNCDHCCGTGRK